MKFSTKWFIVVIMIFIAGFIIIRLNKEIEPGKYDDFAKCLNDSGAKMYGTYWCPHCMAQKKMFGSSAQYLPYIECDPKGENAEPQVCEDAGIPGYPTWIFSNGETISGSRPLDELASYSGCELPQ